jgi:hypothetical protein
MRGKPLHLIIFSSVNSKDGIDFAMLFTRTTARKAGGLHFSRHGGIVKRLQEKITASALTPKPPGLLQRCGKERKKPVVGEP